MLMLVATCSRGAKHAIISCSVESGPAGLGHKRGASCRDFHFQGGRIAEGRRTVRKQQAWRRNL